MSLDRGVVLAASGLLALLVAVGTGCSTPKANKPVELPVLEGPLLPKGVFFGKPPYKYKGLGVVRASKTYATLNLEMTDELEDAYCRKVFAEAARELLQIAKANGGDGVADVHSVIFLGDGRRETFDRPECTDDGEEGEVLAQGVAIKWIRSASQVNPSPNPASSPAPSP